MNLSQLGERVRSRRERLRLRQADLAAALRVSAQAVSNWERGENAPDLSVLAGLDFTYKDVSALLAKIHESPDDGAPPEG